MAFDISAFYKTLRYQDAASRTRLHAHMKQIAEQDIIIETRKKKYAIATLVCLILSFAGVKIHGLIGEPAAGPSAAQPAEQGLLIISIILSSGLFLMLAFICAQKAKHWHRVDVPYLRYNLPMRLVDMLARDMAPNAMFEVDLDFSSAVEKRKEVASKPHLSEITRGKKVYKIPWQMSCFEDPWMQIRGCFLDNTTFTLTLTQFAITRERRRGKRLKRKSKPKGFEAQLLLEFPRKKYGAAMLLGAEASGAVTLPQGARLKKIKVNDHQLLLRAKLPLDQDRVAASQDKLSGMDKVLTKVFSKSIGAISEYISPDEVYQLFAHMLLSSYQVLNLSKQLSKMPSQIPSQMPTNSPS